MPFGFIADRPFGSLHESKRLCYRTTTVCHSFGIGETIAEGSSVGTNMGPS